MASGRLAGRWLAGLALIAAFVSALRAEEKSPRQPAPAVSPAENELVERLVQRLNDNDFRVREKSTEALEQLGEENYPLLRRHLAATRDPEVNFRLRRVLASAADLRPVAAQLRVAEFLLAVQTGDEEGARKCLTRKALEEMDKANMYVQPPGSLNATYKVGGIRLVGSLMLVDSVWKDVAPDGHERSYDILWHLRQEPDGWRVSGMSTQLAEDMPRLILNFENPADMRRQVEEAERALAGRGERPKPIP